MSTGSSRRPGSGTPAGGACRPEAVGIAGVLWTAVIAELLTRPPRPRGAPVCCAFAIVMELPPQSEACPSSPGNGALSYEHYGRTRDVARPVLRLAVCAGCCDCC